MNKNGIKVTFPILQIFSRVLRRAKQDLCVSINADGEELFANTLPKVELPRWLSVKNPPANARDTKDMGLIPGSGSPVFNLEKCYSSSTNPGGLESAQGYLCEREMLNIWGNSACVPFRFPC